MVKIIRQSTKYFGCITHPNEKAFAQLDSLLDDIPTPDVTVDGNSDVSVMGFQLQDHFFASDIEIVKHFCSMVNRPIKSKVQEEFAKLKFALLIDLAIDIASNDRAKCTVAEIQDMIVEEISKVNDDNVQKWIEFSNDYLKELDKISSEDVKHAFTVTFDGTMNVDAF